MCRRWARSRTGISCSAVRSATKAHSASSDGFKRSDLLACAASAGLAKARAVAMLEEVRAAVVEWRFVAGDAGLADRRIDAISRTLRTIRDDFD